MSINAEDFDEVNIPLERIFLDPNNYRLSKCDFEPIPEDEIIQPEIQLKVFNDIKKQEGYGELKNSIIEAQGLLERIIVVPLGDENYLVLEGNRRVTCLKDIQKEILDAKRPEPEEDFWSFVPANLLRTEADTPQNRKLILSIRHVVGTKEWDPYAKAKIIKAYKEEDELETIEIANKLGMSTTMVMRLYRAINAFEQFHEETGCSDTSKFSYFVEAAARPNIREWLGMNDIGICEKNERTVFYSLIVEREDGTTKMPMAIHVRQLSDVIGDDDAYTELLSFDGNIFSAHAIVESSKVTWPSKIMAAYRALDRITRAEMRDMDEDKIELLNKLKESIEQVLSEIRRLRD